ncbi:MAG: methylated-DNA--[protein]-cysteine S-methyltransferase [Trueperaceae bacterium]
MHEADDHDPRSVSQRSSPEPSGPTPFARAVARAVHPLPEGSVATYGDVATWIGRPGAARQVGMALRRIADNDPDLPWHRIVNASGGISTYKVGAGELQEALLRREGVVLHDGRIDLASVRFRPHDPI